MSYRTDRNRIQIMIYLAFYFFTISAGMTEFPCTFPSPLVGKTFQVTSSHPRNWRFNTDCQTSIDSQFVLGFTYRTTMVCHQITERFLIVRRQDSDDFTCYPIFNITEDGPLKFTFGTTRYKTFANQSGEFTDICEICEKPSVTFVAEELQSIQVCENTTQEVICEGSTHITIINAAYGRNEETTCPHSSVNVSFSSPCSQDVKWKIEQLCRNRKNCSITPSNTEYGSDPCPGVYKYLTVDYICSASTTQPADCDIPSMCSTPGVVCDSNDTIPKGSGCQTTTTPEPMIATSEPRIATPGPHRHCRKRHHRHP